MKGNPGVEKFNNFAGRFDGKIRTKDLGREQLAVEEIFS
jgi:hypothetical protein